MFWMCGLCAQKTRQVGGLVIKCMFLGYLSGVKGYKLRDATLSKCVISRDVIFRKNVMLLAKMNSSYTVHLDKKKVTKIEVEHINGREREVEVEDGDVVDNKLSADDSLKD